jgi:protein O-mannosyl-transferase
MSAPITEHPSSNVSRWQVPLVCLVLAAITFAVFGQTLRHGFIAFDDNDYVYSNPEVTQGLTLKGVLWAFSFHAHNWHPLTWLSHMLDCQLYGVRPGGHHLTNVLLHAATVVALFLVLRQMTGALWRSAFVAAVFAIHPLRVESVAWVAERKDLLSGLFFMLTIGAYTRYARRPWSWGRYGLVLLLFVLGLMCKPMLVTLPLVLLLLDYWPLQRVESAGRLVLEKLPLLALAAAACVATLLAQTGAVLPTSAFSLPLRLANALTAFVVYLRQMVWPAGLAVLYPYPLNGLPGWEVALAGMLLAGLSAVALWQRRKQPWILVGWLWYLAMLLPVVGIIQVGVQSHADRYTYLPQIGIYVALTWLVAEWVGKRLAAGLMTVVIVVLMACAWKQTTYWQNSETVWTRSLSCTTDNYVAEANLGSALCEDGMVDEAIAHFQKALRLNPGNAMAHSNLAAALRKKNRIDEAITQFQEALRLKPDFAEAHLNLGSALLQKGRVDEAITHFEKALQSQPDFPEAQYNLGTALRQKGKLDEAIAHYQSALQIKPDYAEAQNNLGDSLAQKGRLDEAMAHFQKALQIKPDYADAHLNLGVLLFRQSRVDEAMDHYETALQIKPDYAAAHYNLGNALLQKGNAAEAIRQFQQALQITPSDPEVQNNLAWLLATSAEPSLRNGKQAVDLAQKANALTGGKDPLVFDTLAAAFAEVGRFGDARESVQKAIELARVAGRQDLAAQFSGELKYYQKGLPLHEAIATDHAAKK